MCILWGMLPKQDMPDSVDQPLALGDHCFFLFCFVFSSNEWRLKSWTYKHKTWKIFELLEYLKYKWIQNASSFYRTRFLLMLAFAYIFFHLFQHLLSLCFHSVFVGLISTRLNYCATILSSFERLYQSSIIYNHILLITFCRNLNHFVKE